MNKLKVLLFDVFFIVSGLIGVGFATGKEISHFFISGYSILIATIIFFAVFVILCWYFFYIKNKYNISTLTEINKLAFGKYYKWCNVLLLITFIVTNAAMLAGCDNLAKTYLNLNIPVISLFLSLVTFFIVLGGVNKIKYIANIIMPILILVIIINATLNMGGTISFDGNKTIDIIYPIIFCCENFTVLLSVMLNTKSKTGPLVFISATIISVVVFMCALAIGNLNADMPMLNLSKNLGNVFFAIYLIGVIFALFTTLEITSYNSLEVAIGNRRKDKHFVLFMILATSQIMAYLGFNFIVKHLYTAIGVLSAIYLIVLIIKLIIIDKKIK